MLLKKKKNSASLQKKLIRLKINPLNNNKFLKLVLVSENTKTVYQKLAGQILKREITIQKFEEVAKKRKQKWNTYIQTLVKANKFFQKYKPYTFNHYDVSNFASQGNSYKKSFKKNLFARKIFNLFYGGLKQKYLKRLMTHIYRSKQQKNPRNLCIELFESRLDSVLRRARFCSSIKDARQLITHRHIYVNKKIETNYSYTLKQGDLIQINPNSYKIIKNKLNTQFDSRFDSVFWPMVPNYLNVNYVTFDIIFGDIKNFNFSATFNFKNANDRVVESYYRH
jgi:ribosomal protein S4